MTKAEAMAAALNEFLDVSWEVEAAAVVSPDGLPMASALPPDVEEDRLAAMSASLLTLGERAAHNLNRGELAQVLVEGERGYVLLMAAGPSAVLVAVTSHDAKVGLVLFEMKKAVESIAAVMDGSFRQAEGVAPETRIAVDPAALWEPEARAGAPPAPPERIWESGSSQWRSGAEEPQGAPAEDAMPAESSAADDVVEPDDAVAAEHPAEHPRGSDFSVPGGAEQTDPAEWDPQSSPVAVEQVEQQETAEDGSEGEPSDGGPATAGWRHRRSQNRSQETAAESAETAEPAETEPAPSWR